MSIDLYVDLTRPVFLRPLLPKTGAVLAEMLGLPSIPEITLHVLENGHREAAGRDELRDESSPLFLISISGEPETVRVRPFSGHSAKSAGSVYSGSKSSELDEHGPRSTRHVGGRRRHVYDHAEHRPFLPIRIQPHSASVYTEPRVLVLHCRSQYVVRRESADDRRDEHQRRIHDGQYIREG